MSRIEAAIALIPKEGRWFLQRRDPASAVLPGLWEFPGGKLEAGEVPIQTLRRELAEELAWEPERVVPLPVLVAGDAQRELRLHPFRCEGASRLGTVLAWGWFTAEEIRRLPIPPANGPLLRLLGHD